MSCFSDRGPDKQWLPVATRTGAREAVAVMDMTLSRDSCCSLRARSTLSRGAISKVQFWQTAESAILESAFLAVWR